MATRWILSGIVAVAGLLAVGALFDWISDDTARAREITGTLWATGIVGAALLLIALAVVTLRRRTA